MSSGTGKGACAHGFEYREINNETWNVCKLCGFGELWAGDMLCKSTDWTESNRLDGSSRHREGHPLGCLNGNTAWTKVQGMRLFRSRSKRRRTKSQLALALSVLSSLGFDPADFLR